MDVLVVDDHPANRQLISAILETIGARVDCAEEGEAAVAACLNRYDVILMDTQMPVLDSPSATRAVRVRQGSRTPAIASTANILPDHKA